MAACNENLLQLNPLSLALMPLLPGRGTGKRIGHVGPARAGAVIAVLAVLGLALQAAARVPAGERAGDRPRAAAPISGVAAALASLR